MLQEFKTFIRRGNVMDLAVGIIIGAAFGKIISSLVADMLMPPIGYVLGNVDFKDLALTIRSARLNADGSVADPAIVLSYGRFIQTIIDFLIIAFCVFLLVKVINRIQGPPPVEAPKPPPEDVQLLREIRDILKSRPTAAPGAIP
jgi:large conductance mechanosensitive channel